MGHLEEYFLKVKMYKLPFSNKVLKLKNKKIR